MSEESPCQASLEFKPEVFSGPPALVTLPKQEQEAVPFDRSFTLCYTLLDHILELPGFAEVAQPGRALD